MKKILIKNARVVNEGKTWTRDLLLQDGLIAKMDDSISQPDPQTRIIDAQGHYLLPGLIDDQVHFREPGLTHKATIRSESRAAVAGGITSYIEQPNTKPPATTLEKLEDKYRIAARDSLANYAFNLGGANDNLEELLRADPKRIPGIKVFMGSSTGNMLVDDRRALEEIFRQVRLPVITHCEDEATIRSNLEYYRQQYGEDIPMELHPAIRSREACLASSSLAVELARQYGTRLHVFHISTAEECQLFEAKKSLKDKKITAEACLHHLWFSDEDYATKGALVKWNPAVKTAQDREAILQAVLEGRIDVLATDHAPHTLEEKQQPYTQAPSGGPLVQHALPAYMEMVLDGKMKLTTLVEKMCHNPARLFAIRDRGFVKEGYQADLVIMDPSQPWTVRKDNILAHCGWSPFENTTFRARISHTLVNGQVVYEKGRIVEAPAAAQRLEFAR